MERGKQSKKNNTKYKRDVIETMEILNKYNREKLYTDKSRVRSNCSYFRMKIDTDYNTVQIIYIYCKIEYKNDACTDYIYKMYTIKR